MKNFIKECKKNKGLLEEIKKSKINILKSIITGMFFSLFICIVPIMVLVNLLIFYEYLYIIMAFLYIMSLAVIYIFLEYYYKCLSTYYDTKEIKFIYLKISNLVIFAAAILVGLLLGLKIFMR